ncbi:XRE family transcriptional regulator [Firmicutes bacterium AM59-13]|nr:XRE family transcriptional regulator [Firmicutes bacterium AM59-13]
MTISEQIRVLCIRSNISVAELARRLGKSPQSFNSKLKRESFTIKDLEEIAEATGTSFRRNYILPNGEEI